MRPKELFERVRDDLKSLQWPSSSNKIFDQYVNVVPEIPIQNLGKFGSPHAFVLDDGKTMHPHHNEIMEQRLDVVYFVENRADKFGEGTMLDSNRVSSTVSPGAGVLEIEQETVESIRKITTLGGDPVTLIGSSAVRALPIRGNRPLVTKRLKFRALVSTNTSGTPDEEEILRMPGFLYWGATDIPNGQFGTLLGYLGSGIVFDPGYNIEVLREMDSGTDPKILIMTGNYCEITVEFLNYNAVTVARLFPGMTTSDQVTIPNGVKTGTDYAGGSFTDKLVFVPDNQSNNPVVVFPKASPVMMGSVRMAKYQSSIFLCRFVGLKSGSTMCYIGPKASAP